MAQLDDMMEYIIANYPRRYDLSNARLTKLVYLTDWVRAILDETQATSIRWYFDNYGPYVSDILETAKQQSDRFGVIETAAEYGAPKSLIELKQGKGTTSLTDRDRNAADHVIKQTASMEWSDFIRLVYSTHPIITSDRYSHLDLVSKAMEYTDQQAGQLTTDAQ